MSLGIQKIKKGWVKTWPVQWIVRLIVGFLRFCAEIVYHVPQVLKRASARWGSWWLFDVIGLRRHVVLHNLVRVFPRSQEESQGEYRARLERLGRANYEQMILFFWELLERSAWTQARCSERIRVHGFGRVRELIDQKKGFFFLTAHLGNWELISKAGVGIGIPLAIITRYLRNLFWNEVWVHLRQAYGLELLEEFGSGLQVVKAIRRGRAVGFMMDQHTGDPHGILARFLGVECMCSKGLAVLSMRLEAPIVPAFLIRAADGTHDLHFEAPVDWSDLEKLISCGELKSGSVDVHRYHIERCNEIMESWIRQNPAQYLWLHKRFKGVFLYEDPLPWAL